MKTIKIGPGHEMFLFADSAMGRDSQPLFLPQGEWKGEVFLAARIGRLGKCVREKFALRYVDGLTLALVASPAGADAYPAWLGIMDGAVTVSADPQASVPLGDATSVKIAAREASLGGDAIGAELAADMPWGQAEQAIAQAIALVTQRATIKTGDIIIPPLAPIELPLLADTRIEAFIDADGSPARCLSLKVK